MQRGQFSKRLDQIVTPREKFDVRQEIKLIPGWSVVLAVVLFLGMQWLFMGYIWPSEQNPPPLPVQILMTTFAASILAFFVLLIAYVNKDAGRRGMSRTLWTLIVIFVPNGIGFIIYFVVRQPLLLNCPQCGNIVSPGVNFCPSCRFSFSPTCPQCRSAVNPGDAFCPRCGLDLGAVE
jgi:RNA polymerase subunit RPABC4/transcription elongation factor Spt4